LRAAVGPPSLARRLADELPLAGFMNLLDHTIVNIASRLPGGEKLCYQR
jgi:hypothetical protein